MVRSIVGTLVDVGLGKASPGDIRGILVRRDREAAGQVAPPYGLVLWEVGYPVTTIRGTHADHLVPVDEIVGPPAGGRPQRGQAPRRGRRRRAVDGGRVHGRRAGRHRPAGARVDRLPHARPARGDRRRPPRPPVARTGGVRARRLRRRPPPRVRGLRPPRRGARARSSTRCASGWPGTTTSCSTARTSPSSAAAGSTPRADPSECGRAGFPTPHTPMTFNTRMAASGGGAAANGQCRDCDPFAVLSDCDWFADRGRGDAVCSRCTSRTGSSTARRRWSPGSSPSPWWRWSLRMTAKTLDEREVPVVGLVAAFVFAVQMLNFPVANGTSGHLLGGVLAAVLVGPYAGAAGRHRRARRAGAAVRRRRAVGARAQRRQHGARRRLRRLRRVPARAPPARTLVGVGGDGGRRRRLHRRRCWPPSRSPSSTPSAATTRCRSAPSPAR